MTAGTTETAIHATPPSRRDTITYGAVHLDVVDGERSLVLWRDQLGLTLLSRATEELRLGAAGRELIVLHPGAQTPQLRGHAGLYHVAVHLPDEEEFARVLARLARNRVPQAPTDHVFSKATYLSDPDGIGIELTVETPERFAAFEIGPSTVVIRDSEGRSRGPTEALDVDEALTHLKDDDLDRPFPAGTTVGHVHLHVGDLEQARRFYRDVVGFEDHMFLAGIGMADLSAGGRFPHRLALNIWQGLGAKQPPAGTAGLRHFELRVADGAALVAIRARLDDTRTAYALDGDVLATHDPAGNVVHVGLREGAAA
jgi:catechol 2,3-dioxygenase